MAALFADPFDAGGGIATPFSWRGRSGAIVNYLTEAAMGTRSAEILDTMRRPGGASIAQMMCSATVGSNRAANRWRKRRPAAGQMEKRDLGWSPAGELGTCRRRRQPIAAQNRAIAGTADRKSPTD
jgi:hypothetical protein